MIIFKDKNIHQCSLYPDTDWTGEASWVIPDNNVDLCSKALEYCPNFNVVTDEDNNVIDIVKTDKLLSEVVSKKIKELSLNCQQAISNGFDFKEKHYSLQINDQLNLEALKNSISENSAAIPYHADNELCQLYSLEDFLEIYKLASYHKMYHTTYFNQLKDMIKHLTLAEDIDKCYYGMELDEEHQNNLNQLLGLS